METNIEYTNLFEDVVELIGQTQNKMQKVLQIVGNTDLIKKQSKKVLLEKINTIFNESTAIVDKLAKLGKVK